MSKPIIVVDPGHGGQDPGALGHEGAKESELNLALAAYFFAYSLSFGEIDPRLLRTTDIYLSLQERAQRSNEIEPAAFLSFHNNAATAPGARGFEVYTSPGLTPADNLATQIYQDLALTIPYVGRADYDDGDPDKEERFYVLRKTQAPAVLIEFGFMTNLDDLRWLQSPTNQAAAANAVRRATTTWLQGRGIL